MPAQGGQWGGVGLESVAGVGCGVQAQLFQPGQADGSEVGAAHAVDFALDVVGHHHATLQQLGFEDTAGFHWQRVKLGAQVRGGGDMVHHVIGAHE